MAGRQKMSVASRKTAKNKNAQVLGDWYSLRAWADSGAYKPVDFTDPNGRTCTLKWEKGPRDYFGSLWCGNTLLVDGMDMMEFDSMINYLDEGGTFDELLSWYETSFEYYGL